MKDGGLTPEEMAARAPADLQDAVKAMHEEAAAFMAAFAHRYFDPNCTAVTLVIRHKPDTEKSLMLSSEVGADILKVIDVVQFANAVRLDSIAKAAPSTGRMQ